MITKIETAKFKCKTCEHIFEGIYTEGGIKAGTNFPLCPKCGKPMIKRIAKKGKNAGNEFWSCSSYPECDGTRNV